ncbi:MAG: hypothetical protein CMJ18_27360 [Phycisphaeraceae bacterium]|nr:hypothetical protein [Phycisphaeraceae bacterium]
MHSAADGFGTRRLVDDLRADDFGQLRADLARVRGAMAQGNETQRVRSIFKFGFEAGLFDKPMRFGPEFVKPSAKAVREARQKAGQKMLEPAQIRALIEAASVPTRAMILPGSTAGSVDKGLGIGLMVTEAA